MLNQSKDHRRPRLIDAFVEQDLACAMLPHTCYCKLRLLKEFMLVLIKSVRILSAMQFVVYWAAKDGPTVQVFLNIPRSTVSGIIVKRLIFLA